MARRARVLGGEHAGDHAQALRRHLIRVTQRLLAAHGLTGLTTRFIAREAEVSDGVLYNHFADKDDLIVTALAEQVIELVRRYLDGCPRPGEQDLRSGLTQLARLSLRFQAEALPLAGALLSRPDLLHRLLEQVHAGGPGPQLLFGSIVDYVEGEKQRGTVTPDVDPAIVARVLFGAQHLAALAQVLRPRTGDTASHLAPDEDQLVAFLLRACATTP